MKITVTLDVVHDDDVKGASRDDVVDALLGELENVEFAVDTDEDSVDYRIESVNIGKA